MQDNAKSSPISFTIVRHGKVKANFPMFCTSKEFDEYMDYYDKADIYPIGKQACLARRRRKRLPLWKWQLKCRCGPLWI